MESIQESHLKIIDGATAGAWIKPRLAREVGSVASAVPMGFDAYARVLHPAYDQEGNPVRWSDVAKIYEATAHALMQWHALTSSRASSYGRGSRWLGSDPSLGEMDLEDLDELCKILIANTKDPDSCFFGLCEIWSWVDDVSSRMGRRQRRLKLPLERVHVVLRGGLTMVDQIIDDVRQYAPGLIWPNEQSWFVASDVDFDSTLVGGSAKLIKAIIESPALEAWQVEPTDALTVDTDKVNRPIASEEGR